MSDDGGRAPVRYRFGPLHRPGLIAGFRSGQVAAVGAALLVAVGVLRASPTIGGMAGALAVVGLGVGVASWPVAGRTAEEWAPDALHFASGRLARVRHDGRFFRWTRLASVSVEGGAELGVLVDRHRGVHSTVMAIEAPALMLLGAAERDRRVADWSSVLASLSRDRGSVYRLQWVERAVPDDASAHAADARERGVLAPGEPARASYAQLLGKVSDGSVCHGVLLVLSVRPQRSRGPVRSAPDDGAAAALLVREVAVLRRRMADAGVGCSPPFGAEEVAGLLRSAVAPASAVAAAAAEAAGSGMGAGRRGQVVPRRRRHHSGSPAWSWPWPMAVEERWACLRTDGTWHATFWVAEWPRADVHADFMTALLLVGDVRRTVSMVMEPVGPSEAVRQVERARTAEAADSELRARGGFLATARRRRQAEHLAGREVELADGHATFRFTAYVSVTADDPASLELACERVQQAAVQSGLELRRCYADQLRAFAAVLPLGTGLP